MAVVHFKLSIDTYDVSIDLEKDLGYDSKTEWSDLTEDEQTEIKDNIREQYVLRVSPKE
jgi:hypothetical protein